MKIKNLLKIYEEHLKHLKKIRRGHKKPDDLYRKIFNFFKNEEITKISERDIEKYIQSQQLVGRKNSGINHDLYAFKKFLKWAWINKYTNKKLFEKIKKIREEKYKPVILSEFELEKIKKSILEETNIDYKIIFWLLTNYGIRIGEILRLKWNEIDILRNEIAIWTEKTGGYRIFEMDSVLNKMFKEKLKKGQKIQNEYVFINPKTLKPYYDLKKPWRRILERANIQKIRIYDLRHNFAMDLARKNYTPEEIAKILGHSDIRSVNHYFHPFRTKIEKFILFKKGEKNGKMPDLSKKKIYY